MSGVIQMKPKLVAIIVISILTLSVVATAVAAIGQVVDDGSGALGPGQGRYAGRSADSATQSDSRSGNDSALARSFRLVCPFH